MDDGRPAVAVIGGGVDLASTRAEVPPARIETVDRHRVTQHVDVAVLLRKPLAQGLPLVPARPAAVDAQLAVRYVVKRVAGDRDHVDSVRLVRVNVDHETEVGRQVAADLAPRV